MRSRVPGSLVSAVRETIADFIAHDPFGEAAALSFYALLSLVPLLLIVVGVAGLAWGDEAATGQLSIQMGRMVGPEAAEVIQTVIANASRSGRGPAAVAFGAVTLASGATMALVRLKAALNRIFGVRTGPAHGALWRFLHTRLVSLAIVLAAGSLLVVSLGAGAVLAALHHRFVEVIPDRLSAWRWDGFLMSWLLIALLIALIYRLLPDAGVPWASAAAGALATTACFALGRTLVGIYVHRAGIGSAFGAAGSLIVFLVWIFYASLSLLLGGEVAKAWSRRSKRRPAA